VPFAPLILSKEYVLLSSVLDNEKSGAWVPKANMFEGVRAITFFSKIGIKYHRITSSPFSFLIKEMDSAKRD
jgi:hypothetical protein